MYTSIYFIYIHTHTHIHKHMNIYRYIYVHIERCRCRYVAQTKCIYPLTRIYSRFWQAGADPAGLKGHKVRKGEGETPAMIARSVRQNTTTPSSLENISPLKR